MRDVALLVLIGGFFGVAVAYVRACTSLVGGGKADTNDQRDHGASVT
jgi:hypothetical protein